MNKNFGDYLYTLRTEKGWTQQQLADLLGVTNKTVSKWERNEGYPSIDTLLSLSKLFNISVDELLKGGNRSTPEDSMELLLQEWQSKKMKMLTNVILFIGLLVFFGMYFWLHEFVVSFFVLLIFALVSISLLLYRQEKLLHLLKQERNKKDIFIWLCWLGVCLSMMFPCAIGEFVTYTIVEGIEVNLYISFKDYFVTWFPLCVALAFVFVMVYKVIREDLFYQIKKKLKNVVALFVGITLFFTLLFGFVPSFKSYGLNYKQLKANYYSLVESFGGEALKPKTMNTYFEGKQVYEKYVNLIGFIDLTNTFVYRRPIDDWSSIFAFAKCGFIVFTVASGYYLFYRKEKNVEELKE